MNERVFTFTYEDSNPERLDKYLVKRLPEFSRSRLQSLIKSGSVTINQKTIHKSGYELNPGSVVQIVIPPQAPSRLIPEDIPLDILFENEDLMVVNKPAGMVVHPSAGHDVGTLVHAALSHAPEMEGVGGEVRPGVVHRLDKDTSGIILLAKNDRSHQLLQSQFKDRKVQKVYLALVDGKPPTPKGHIEAAIGRDPRMRKKMAVVPPNKGREAISDYSTLESFPEHTLLEVHPHTGRTHQIRLHLAYIGCPVAGDEIYGKRHSTIPVKRHFLHAYKISLQLPGEEKISTFEAPLPAELEEVLNQLRNKS